MKKITILLCVLFVSFLSAQDIIIKKDQSEIKSKVVEITEKSIKYKKWKSQNGPTYNIKKSEVFMIIYANGEKEYYNKKTEVVTSNYNNQVYSTNTNQTTNNQNTTTTNSIYKDITRVNIGLGGIGYPGFDVYSLGYSMTAAISPISDTDAIDMDLLGAITAGEFGDDSLLMYSIGLGVGYGVFYNESFKLSAGIGYAYNFGTITSTNYDLDISFGGFYYYSNIDYFLSDSFGVNIRYDYVMGTSFGVIWEY